MIFFNKKFLGTLLSASALSSVLIVPSAYGAPGDNENDPPQQSHVSVQPREAEASQDPNAQQTSHVSQDSSQSESSESGARRAQASIHELDEVGQEIINHFGSKYKKSELCNDYYSALQDFVLQQDSDSVIARLSSLEYQLGEAMEESGEIERKKGKLRYPDLKYINKMLLIHHLYLQSSSLGYEAATQKLPAAKYNLGLALGNYSMVNLASLAHLPEKIKRLDSALVYIKESADDGYSEAITYFPRLKRALALAFRDYAHEGGFQDMRITAEGRVKMMEHAIALHTEAIVAIEEMEEGEEKKNEVKKKYGAEVIWLQHSLAQSLEEDFVARMFPDAYKEMIRPRQVWVEEIPFFYQTLHLLTDESAPKWGNFEESAAGFEEFEENPDAKKLIHLELFTLPELEKGREDLNKISELYTRSLKAKDELVKTRAENTISIITSFLKFFEDAITFVRQGETKSLHTEMRKVHLEDQQER